MDILFSAYIFTCLIVSHAYSVLVTKRLGILIASLGVAFFIAGLNLPDYSTYKTIYQQSPGFYVFLQSPVEYFSTIKIEPGYIALNSFFKLFGVPFDLFRLLLVFFIVYAKLSIISKISDNFIISVSAYFAFLFFMDMFILRQALASTIIAISIYFLVAHENKKALFCLAISPLFHVLSLLAIPVLIIFRLNPPRAIYLGLLMISMCIGIFGLGGIMSELAVSILGTDSFIGDKIYRYSIGPRADATGVIRFSTLIILSSLAFVILFLSDKYRERKFYIILNTSIYAFLILVLLNDIGIFGDRGYRMVAFPLMLIFPYISMCFAKRYQILINYIIFTSLLVLSVFFVNASYISWLC